MVWGCFFSRNDNSIVGKARAFLKNFFITKEQSLSGTLALLSASNAKWEIIGLRSSWDISGAAGRKAGIGK